jgi:O-acetyl-ADP-ribose deacetylase (regulator of RNase III)
MSVKFMKPVLNVVLVDVNAAVVRAWGTAFADTPEVSIVKGSILTQAVDAWVTPTNSRGRMDGGVDAVVKRYLGTGIERKVQSEIAREYNGVMPVGAATCVPTGADFPRFLISTPTMVASSEDVSETMNVALACAAAFQAIHLQNAREPDSIASVALVGLGAATGRVPPRVCANLMWTGYTLFNEHNFGSYEAMRATLEEELGGLGPKLENERVRVQLPAYDEHEDHHGGGCCH